MNAPFPIPAVTRAPNQQVYWCGFEVEWPWDFGNGDGPTEILLEISTNGQDWSIHSVKGPDGEITGPTRDVIVAVLSDDSAFNDYVATRAYEEADEALAWER